MKAQILAWTKVALAAAASAAIPVIQHNGLPTTGSGWLALLGMVLVAEGALLVHSPAATLQAPPAPPAPSGPLALMLMVGLATLGLSACSPQQSAIVSTDYTKLQGLIATDWPEVKAVAAAYCASGTDPAACAKVAAAEPKIDAEVAAIGATTPPVTLTAIFADVNALLPMIGGQIKPRTYPPPWASCRPPRP
jgi:hypothetical protein